MSLDERPLEELLNRTGDGPVINAEWIDALLEVKLPGVLTKLAETEPVSIPDFVKLALMEREMHPADTADRVVVWVDRPEDGAPPSGV